MFSIRRQILLVLLASVATGCVTSGTHEQLLAELGKTQDELAKHTDELEKEKEAKSDIQSKLEEANKTIQSNETILASLNMKVEKLTGEKGKLSDKQKEMRDQIQNLETMKKAAEQRNADFRKLLVKLKKMMDAGTLKVKPRNGLLVVQMSSDVMFSPGSTRLKPEAKEALSELALTLASFPGRRFQVIGHCDNKPINSARFPSNWELSTARAVVVAKLLIESGVEPEMISAAGNAEFDPLVPNDSPENRSINRRVEIVFLPKIDELPGFDRVLSGS